MQNISGLLFRRAEFLRLRCFPLAPRILTVCRRAGNKMGEAGGRE